MTKNTTRIASLMGTWTAQTAIKSSIGDYKAIAYFTVHFMPDSMRGHGCELPGCNEIDNEICSRHVRNNGQTEACMSMEDNVHNWSDVSAFVSFGARVDAGFPFRVHKSHDTGDWIGPLSVIMAQNKTLDGNVVDKYSIRYVVTPTTPYLQMDPNCSLFSPADFENYMGLKAVQETIKVQSTAVHGRDPYSQFLQTCDNGDVKPILPLLDFTFIDTGMGKEQIQVTLDYKVLTFPHKTDIMYKVYPRLQKRLNTPGSDFHISGPYCYGNDPKRGYTFDFSYDSGHESNLLKLVHGCVEGFPCLPSAAEIQPAFGGSGSIIHNTTNKGDVHTLNVGPILTLSLLVVVLSLGLVVSLSVHCFTYLRRRVILAEEVQNGLEYEQGLDEPLVTQNNQREDANNPDTEEA